jgi:hypothetical protein
MKRPGQPVEMAPLYVLLASQESSYVTGEVYWSNRRNGDFVSDEQRGELREARKGWTWTKAVVRSLRVVRAACRRTLDPVRRWNPPQ